MSLPKPRNWALRPKCRPVRSIKSPASFSRSNWPRPFRPALPRRLPLLRLPPRPLPRRLKSRRRRSPRPRPRSRALCRQHRRSFRQFQKRGSLPRLSPRLRLQWSRRPRQSRLWRNQWRRLCPMAGLSPCSLPRPSLRLKGPNRPLPRRLRRPRRLRFPRLRRPRPSWARKWALFNCRQNQHPGWPRKGPPVAAFSPPGLICGDAGIFAARGVERPRRPRSRPPDKGCRAKGRRRNPPRRRPGHRRRLWRRRRGN
jgi:hypothetical protein